MKDNLSCSWMGLELSSPYVIASLTLVSKVTITQHVEYYKKAYQMGAGAIVLPSINPSSKGNREKNNAIADCLKFYTGLNSKHTMGFTVLGPSEPNIVSIDYGTHLAQEVRKSIPLPIIGSIANIGSDCEVIGAIDALCSTGIDGIELNFSCPNVVNTSTNQTKLTIELLRKIRNKCKLPISLKITPYMNYSDIICFLDKEVDGLTLSNAYVGLIPPNIEGDNFSPFDRRTEWSPSGVYGPFERMLTYSHLYDYHHIASSKGLSIACVGGIVDQDEAIQAILLGADVVQLSSAILWNGLKAFEKFNNHLESYMIKRSIFDIKQIKGIALQYIKDCADILDHPIQRTMIVNDKKCMRCDKCSCCDRLCIAISQKNDRSVVIDKDLCSGCKMCYYLCPNSAIEVRA